MRREGEQPPLRRHLFRISSYIFRTHQRLSLWAVAVLYILYYLYLTLTYQIASPIYFVYFVDPRGLKQEALPPSVAVGRPAFFAAVWHAKRLAEPGGNWRDCAAQDEELKDRPQEDKHYEF
jgi:hypothetical protein